MLSRRGLAFVAATSAGAILLSPGLASADDGPIVVMPGGKAWISTAVTDSGAPAAPRKAAKRPARTCTQYKSNSAGGYATEEQFASGAYPSAGPGGWVIRRCSDGSLDTAWVPAVPLTATIEQLAKRATNRLPLPLPAPKFNPSRPSSAGPATLVAIPTWFWVDGWEPVRQRTQAGAVWAEVVATPTEATWDPGDGSPLVRCAGPGTAWSPAARASTCEHTYVRSSAGQPANVYTAHVTVTWRVSWRGVGGRTGTLPLMERQMTFPIAVAERQTVVTVGGTP